MDNAQKIWGRLISAGLTEAGAAGLMGNLYAESGLRPDNLQNSCEKRLVYSDSDYTAAVDCGVYTGFVTDGAGYGLAQWTYPSRKAALLAYARARGRSIGDLDMQVGYLLQELQSLFPAVLRLLRTTDSFLDASNIVLLEFERPANKSVANCARRVGFAQEFYDKFTKKGERPMTPQERLIATAEDQIGYMGKKTSTNLDDFKANTPGLYNKFARDLDALEDFYNGKKNGYDWCDVFVDWCFVETFGRAVAQLMLGQPDRSLGAGTGYSLGYYKAKGRLFSTPEPGDQIFFGDAKSTWHTGIVVRVEGGFVHTIEGNAGNPSAVRAGRYVIGGKNIKGYGRPDWSLVPEEKEEDEMVYFKTLADVPSYYKDAVGKAVKAGALNGTGDGLNVSEDLCRTLTVLDRLGKLDRLG